MAATAVEKPVILFVHGAFHAPCHYTPLIKGIQRAGYTVLAPALPSSGPDASIVGKALADDVARITEVAAPYLDAGRELVVMAHSFGGKPGTEFTGAQAVPERKRRGLTGGVRAIVYLAAFAPPGSPEQSKHHQGERAFFDLDRDSGTFVLRPNAAQIFYGVDMPDSQTRQILYSLLGRQSAASLGAPHTFSAAELQVPRTYVVCTRDEAVVPQAQRDMAEGCSARIVEIDAGHSPWFVDGHVEKLVEVVEAAAGLK
ncbi:Alpha/beta hydrolase fold-1 [Microdochium trichocladiopsis]|uniref:Alpha/beta hydrolase fold-1 n=1 Tax=Microdochium trichocladiopsis TaxID=1682393 RepID=A0A9P8XXK4_9PEZI|nr:Alpha/beta hydrolase fold-1 [Microdochium trichocladiopsis]KAH7024440.1 Alpha/beta hydrolase fold-1 [Microdochium trichocladiopsis]